MIYIVLGPELGSTFLACMHYTSTLRSSYEENNSFFNIKNHFICNWLYNQTTVSP